ncbi:MAG: right-handed parallel beta-helix repeat-containing protein [Methanothrix sp.]|uniref:right-handed parallel beta-helix repeat-containing protein n=1 Tax=Methanothrix sp. TaxID=90426 RepID=UPI0025D568E0|nr:right-handed parallel beta-helix repeat-containing protein [Methanothrix sp.]MCQ8902684.1 right-handed parallel beta-helix repeat-containing protein [Methanothrix sp.]
MTTEGYRMDYMNGMYHIYVNTTYTVKNAKVPVGTEFSDFVLETTAYVVDASKYSEFGLNLRRDAESGDFYRLVLNTDHKFAFFKHKNDSWTDLIPWTRSDALDSNANKIKVVASGEEFTIYINDRLVGSCKDGSIRSGVIDIFGETQDESPVHVAFDYLKIWSIRGVSEGQAPASRNILTVGVGKQYSRIQDAINASTEGDTIEVSPGTYRENIFVDKKLTIHGIGMPVIDAGRLGDGITISADGVTIEGLSVINARGGFLGYSGMMVYSSSNVIRNNSIKLCDKGIELYDSGSNLIEANIIEENDDNGIYLLSGCNENTIRGNRISRNGGDGIHVYESNRNLIFNNLITDNIGDDAYDDYNATELGTGDANRWDDGSRGNYYSDNPCIDSNRDGICDSPYSIPGGDGVDRYPLASPLIPEERPPERPLEGTGSATLSGSQSGSVSLGGAVVDIPAGSIPPNEDGTPGTMVISIEKTDMRPELPEGLSPVGEVYQLGPEGTVFERPVQITLRIPEGVDPNTIIGVTTFNATSGRWELIPGTVDPEGRTVTIFTDHFSPYALVSGADEWMRRNGGWIEVINAHRYNSPPYYSPCAGEERCRVLPTHTEHGICIQNVVFNDPSVAVSWTPPSNWLILAFDVPSGSTRSETRERFWVPAGTYTLTEFLFVSEVNPGDPMYVPCCHAVSKPTKVYQIDPGETLRFDHLSEESMDRSRCVPGGYPCRSAVATSARSGRTTSVHTGDVQVTLTWYANADIDLYVEDPNGDVVYYSNPQVPSGGQLDRDNMCSNFEMGKPENIFWPTGSAPPGVYKVRVNYYSDCEDVGPVRWTVRTVVGGNVKTYTGVLNEVGETQEVTTFEIR